MSNQAIPRQRSAATQSAAKVLQVLEVLLGNFANGLAPSEIARATDLDPSAITRYVITLEDAGFVERIPETGRIRPSVRFAQHAISILRSVDAAKRRIDEVAQRLSVH